MGTALSQPIPAQSPEDEGSQALMAVSSLLKAPSLKFWSFAVFLHGMSDPINVVSEHLIKAEIP